MRRVLFICSRNRLRSPTAERVFADYPEMEVSSAGLAPDAEDRLTPEHLEGVDLIFVMERVHRQKLSRQFGRYLRSARVICLDIPDRYGYMQPELVELLVARVTPHLR
jgi:predicted protein tyrosine phosphatase